jgi:membrane-anchored protein YejM (alkaline phosphatase superfamily)
MRKYFHFELDRETELTLTAQTSPLNYPRGPLERQPLDTYPNIIWILVDAWRSDMFHEEVSPHIWEFSKNALVFDNHYSGGNASRFGSIPCYSEYIRIIGINFWAPASSVFY